MDRGVIMFRRLPKLVRHDDGGATVEFVAAMLFFVVIFFFVMEIGVAVFWNATAEKAAQIGVRLAIVGDPTVTASACPSDNNDGDPVPAGTLPLQNCRNGGTGAIYGRPCSTAGTCHTWGPVTCVGGTGANCDAAGFATIAQRVRSIFNLATDDRITIRYEDTSLGYAGGPVIPLVTVEISNVPYDLLFASLLGRMSGTGTALIQMPTVSATLTGEDLSVDS